MAGWHRKHGFAALTAWAIIVAAGVGLMWYVGEMKLTSEQSLARTRTQLSAIREGNPVETRKGPELTAWRLGSGLDAVEVFDILANPDGSGAWLGTGRGLALVEADGRSTSYRLYPEAPREWVQNIVPTDTGIALTVAVAGVSGSNQKATFLFDLAKREFDYVGPYVRELAWDGTHLYGAMRRRLVRFERTVEGWTTERVVPEVHICLMVDMVYADGALWITHQGAHPTRTSRTGSPRRKKPCGVVRLVPGGETRAWTEDDGLVSGFGQSIVADDRFVFVSHGVEASGLSVYDLASGRWTKQLGESGIRFSANVLGLSPNSVWLGTGYANKPLIRIDRRSGAGELVAGVNDKHFISAVAAYPGGAWIAWSAKQYEGESYHVTTWVARASGTLR